MKFPSILILAMGLAVSACAEQPNGGAQLVSPELDRATWIVNSCVAGDSDDKCTDARNLLNGDLFQVRISGKDPGDGAVFVTVQDNHSAIGTFVGHVVSHQSNDGIEELVIAYLDDPPGERPVNKQLTIQSLRLPNEADSACEDRVRGLAGNKLDKFLNQTNESVCAAARYPTLVYWSICSVVSDGECRRLTRDQFRIMSPPDDGQGTGSGND
jgi:hypothetical protein